ncbi:hypothetical protein [Aeromonas sp. CA23]|nr:hypothetical protein [Aeromonas sp. CA23]
MRIDHYDLQGEVQHQYQQLQARKVRNLGGGGARRPCRAREPCRE